MQSSDGRPIYLDLKNIKLPISGIISIMHRAFGIILSFSIPVLTYLFTLSLQSEDGFNQVAGMLDSGWLFPVYFFFIWSFVHHLFAGIRYLLIDLEIGVEKQIATKSSQVVLVAALVVSFLLTLGVVL
ncbi:MAG: succinate dehydrogenase, cytochrome b556 subunit [Gammaproteobacteria bacterium]|nr:succinate dehydrogenase, cytochrome b556 subunit [Gammaproteobacteria bacterium]